MSILANKLGTWVVAAAALLAVAAALFLYFDYRAAVRGHRQVLVQRGEAILDSVAAGMRAQGRMARARGERILVLIEEAAQIPGVKGIRLDTEDGSAVAEFGEAERLDSVVPGDADWRASTLVQAARVEMTEIGLHPGGMGGPGRRENLTPMPQGPYVLTLALDAGPVYGQLRREVLRLAVSAAVAAGAIVLAAGLLLLQFRRLSLESDLERARETATESQRLARLGAGLAHETKNPLNLVRGLVQDITVAPGLPSSARDTANRIIDEVDRTVGQINAFLEISRPKEPRLEPVDLRLLLNEAVTLVQSEARVKGILLDVGEEQVQVLADSSLLRRAVLNLLINALKACTSGCRVRVSVERDGRVAGFSVTDNGCGIAPEDLPRVKEPYFSRFAGGTGLGLVITEQIARVHGASLVVDSLSGNGTRVTLSGLRRVD